MYARTKPSVKFKQEKGFGNGGKSETCIENFKKSQNKYALSKNRIFPLNDNPFTVINLAERKSHTYISVN